MKTIICSLALLFMSFQLWSQNQEPSILPILDEDYGPEMNAILMDYLQQIAAPEGIPVKENGTSYYITAQVTSIYKLHTMGVPSSVIAKVLLSLSLYSLKDTSSDDVSDINVAWDNKKTLFASYSTELTGVGVDENQAQVDAVRKFSPKDKSVLSFIQQGRGRILGSMRTGF